MSDNVIKLTSASGLYKEKVSARKNKEGFLLKADHHLPEVSFTYACLHPFEIAVFGIDPDIYAELCEAWSWYQGAIALIEDNDYAKFQAQERRAHPEFAKNQNEGDLKIFYPDDCVKLCTR